MPTETEVLVDTGIYLAEVVEVSVVRHYVLDLTFSDGTRKRVDVRPLLQGALNRLRDEQEFRKAEVGLDTVVWPGEPFDLDLAPDTLYELPECEAL